MCYHPPPSPEPPLEEVQYIQLSFAQDFDGCSSVLELADMLDGYARYLRGMHRSSWYLDLPVNRGVVRLRQDQLHGSWSEDSVGVPPD